MFQVARRLVLSAVLASALAAAAHSADAARGWERYAVRGTFAAVDDATGNGKFRISVRTSEDDRVVQRFEVNARKLDATKDAGGALPEYHVFLVNEDGSVEADFGEMALSEDGAARFRFDSRFDTLPDGIDSLSSFLLGKAQIRLGDTVVLEADVPDAIGIDDDGGSGQGAFTARVEDFVATETERKVGQLLVRRANRDGGVNEQLRISMRRLDETDAPYTAYLVDGVNADVTIGELDPNQRRSRWTYDLDTRKGDDVPGEDVRDLAGQTVEIRDKDSNVIATATMPTFE